MYSEKHLHVKDVNKGTLVLAMKVKVGGVVKVRGT